MSYISGRTLKSEAKKFLIFLRVSRNKSEHSSS